MRDDANFAIYVVNDENNDRILNKMNSIHLNILHKISFYSPKVYYENKEDFVVFESENSLVGKCKDLIKNPFIRIQNQNQKTIILIHHNKNFGETEHKIFEGLKKEL